MFDRSAYKKIARQQLKGRFLWPVLMTLMVLFIALSISSVLELANHSGTPLIHRNMRFYRADFSFAFLFKAGSLIFIAVIGILYTAQQSVYLRLSRTVEKASFNDFLAGLELWVSGMLGMFWYCLWVALWSLLFVIPGIVKAYAYSQMFFILAENPGISVRKAMSISKVMTQGHKADLFVMGLSFLGWAILSSITCGIGTLWLIPYMNMSYANAYYDLKNQALLCGKIIPADFAR
jgi:uncharacterized membrane protein